MRRFESIRSNAPDEVIWLRLRRLRSAKLCENILRDKCSNEQIVLPEDVLLRQAIGLSSAVDSALGYLDVQSSNINSKVLTRYYGLLQLTIAEQVASIKSYGDLPEIQKHTESGHGLKTIRDETGQFPDKFYIYCVKSGHFSHFLKHLNVDVKPFVMDKPMHRFVNSDNVVPISDLFRRIPELYSIVFEHIRQKPLCLRIGSGGPQNAFPEALQLAKYEEETGIKLVTTVNPEKILYVNIYCEGVDITIEDIKATNLPFIQCDKGKSGKYYLAAIQIPDGADGDAVLRKYISRHASTSYVAPLYNIIHDPIPINFMLLYGLSIIVRYLPQLWYEIVNGDLNQYYPLIEYYLSVFDHVVPEEMLERITGKSLNIYV